MANKSDRRNRVAMAFGYYEHRMHLGVVRYARKADWILDTAMAHYGVSPNFQHVDGVLALVLPDRRNLIESLRGLRIPIVNLAADVPGIAAAEVLLDNQALGRMAAEHLLERGFRNLAFCKCTDYADIRQREAGVLQAAEAAGVACRRINWHDASKVHPTADFLPWLANELKKLPQPAAVVAQSDHRAYSVIVACEMAGLAVPEQIAVVGIDNDEYACEFAPIPITSVDSNREEYAYRGAEILDRLMRGEPAPQKPIRVPAGGIVVRRSSDILAVEDPEVAKALAFVWQNYTGAIGVENVVAATTMSRCQLYREFNRRLGRTIREEIERKRLELARQLLTSTDETVAQIARRAGFTSGEQFCRVFVRVHGLTPRDFRRTKSQGEANR